jgi:5-methylcytosine-specific restriction protein A
MSPFSPCLEPGCPNYAAPKGRGRCAEHYRQRERERNQQPRRKASRRIYNSKRWKVARSRQLFNHPLCEACLARGVETLASEVDHVIPLSQAGDAWSEENLSSLCKPCHDRKSGEEERRRRGLLIQRSR